MATEIKGEEMLRFFKKETEAATTEIKRIMEEGGLSLESAVNHAFLSGMLAAYMRCGDFLFDHANFMRNGYNVSPFPEVRVQTASSPEDLLHILTAMEDEGRTLTNVDKESLLKEVGEELVGKADKSKLH